MKNSKVPTWVYIAYLVFCLFSGPLGWAMLAVTLGLILLVYLITKLLNKKKSR